MMLAACKFLVLIFLVFGPFPANGRFASSPGNVYSPSGTESPWTWICLESKCVKFEKTTPQSTGTSLAVCKLTCPDSANVWPKVTGKASFSKKIVQFQLANMVFTNIYSPSIKTTDLMKEASSIFTELISNMVVSRTKSADRMADSQKVAIEMITSSNEEILSTTTDESYQLSISTTSSKTTVHIMANTFFGCRHALETLSQLIVWDDESASLVMISDATVIDKPVFPHRGLLIDTSRNFVSVAMIKKILDAMSYNKLNVFHWHMTDTHSFPFVSTRRPWLSGYGAYSPAQVYRPEDIKDLVHYANVRGIKLLPEFDAPAHVGEGWQFGEKLGLGKLVLCLAKEPSSDYCLEPPCGQFNVVNDNVYQVLADVYKDMAELFRSDMFHMGGDELKFKCWNETEEIVDYLVKTGKGRSDDDFFDLWSMFQNRSLAKLDQAYNRKQPVILWTNHMTDHGRAIKYLDPERYIIQVWTTAHDSTIKEVYEQGYRLILSNYDALYFDCGYGSWVGNGANNWCSPYIGWQKVYENSPRSIIEHFHLDYKKEQILGSEAALWTEQVDTTGMENKLWPRGAALAERLWSDPDTPWQDAEFRMMHHRQRLVQRNIAADALQPQWCHQNEGHCVL